jgi:hypothetical protein
VCSGRQAGKSRTLALLALHEAFRAAGRRVLILSAGEDAAKDLLSEISMLAQASLLAGSVVDDTASTLTLSNGSVIRSVPASEKQVRGKSVDLLILDEAAYIEDSLWQAARYTIIARPSSRVVMASTPRGRRDRFFAKHWHMARSGPVVEAGVSIESFHWPSTVSPMVDGDLVEFWRRTDPERVFRTEVLAEWVDEAGAWFTAEELDSNVAPFEMIRPGKARGQLAVAGVDWGATNDANALVVVAVLPDDVRNARLLGDEPVFVVPWFEERYRFGLNEWAKHIAAVGDDEDGGWCFYQVASEANGVGAGPTETLQTALRDRGARPWAYPVWTDNRRKQSAYGVIKLLLQQNRLVLPAEPALRRQLEALEYETSEGGTLRLQVPASKGHDDLADALMQAVSCVRHIGAGRPPEGPAGFGDEVATPAGVRLMSRPLLADHRWAFRGVRGSESNEGGW